MVFLWFSYDFSMLNSSGFVSSNRATTRRQGDRSPTPARRVGVVGGTATAEPGVGLGRPEQPVALGGFWSQVEEPKIRDFFL